MFKQAFTQRYPPLPKLRVQHFDCRRRANLLPSVSSRHHDEGGADEL